MLPRTINPAPTVKSDITRMTSATLVKMESTVWMTEVRSKAETLENFATTAFCNRAEAAASGTRLTSTLKVGAASSTPVGKTTKKFV